MLLKLGKEWGDISIRWLFRLIRGRGGDRVHCCDAWKKKIVVFLKKLRLNCEPPSVSAFVGRPVIVL